MIVRVVTVIAGLLGGAIFSQFPEFSQQYVQRLGGAVDALEQVVADFDASAAAEGLTRDAALAQMTGGPFVERRRADMTRTIERHARLASDLDAMRGASPFLRAYHVARLDGEIVQAAWGDFRPAMPLTVTGLVFATAGFLAGALVAGASATLLRRLRGNRRVPA